MPSTPGPIELHVTAMTTGAVVRRVGAPSLHRRGAVPIDATGTRKLLRVGLLIGPMRCLVATIDTAVLARPTLLPHNAIVRSPIADVRASPARVVFSGWSTTAMNGVDITMPSHSCLMHPAHAMDNFAAAVASRDVTFLSHSQILYGLPADWRPDWPKE